MVANIYVCIFLTCLVYAYVNHNDEFTATASALRQIWSGDCRLSCRQSESSGFSGLSGLRQGVFRGSTQLDGRQPVFNQPGPSSCLCDTCPCSVLETIFRICSPVTYLYSKFIEVLSSCYYELVIMGTDACKYVSRVANCEVTCQRSQLADLKLDSAENINFANASAVKSETAKVGRSSLNLKRSSIIFRRKSEEESGKSELHSSTAGHNIALPRDSLKPLSESKESLTAFKGCSKCIEKGKVCMGNCPQVKERQKK